MSDELNGLFGQILISKQVFLTLTRQLLSRDRLCVFVEILYIST
jgi:hypothetical protein